MTSPSPRRHRLRAALVALVLVPAVCASALVGAAPASAVDGQVSGTVSGEVAGLLSGMKVRVYATVVGGDDWQLVEETATTSDGTYSIDGLTDGAYRVGFSDPLGQFADEYSGDASTLELARDVVVDGSQATQVDALLSPARSIAGVVDGSDVGRLRGVLVTAFERSGGDWRPVRRTGTALDGSYRLSGLRPGSYRLEFADSAGRHVTEYFDDAATLAQARDLAVGDGDLGGVDAVLAALAAPAVQQPAAAAVTVLRGPRLGKGPLVVGRKARVVPGSYTPGTTLTYAWAADRKVVRGATRAAFRLPARLRGTTLRVTVTATLPGATPVVTVLRFRGRVR